MGGSDLIDISRRCLILMKLWATVWWRNYDNMLSRFDRIPERDGRIDIGQTDGQTDGRTDKHTDIIAVSISRVSACDSCRHHWRSRCFLDREKLPHVKKLSHTEIYACGSGRHHRCPICFSWKNSVMKYSRPWKFTAFTLCAIPTRDLLAIAKFLAPALFSVISLQWYETIEARFISWYVWCYQHTCK